MAPRRHRGAHQGRELTRDEASQGTVEQEVRPEWRNGRRAGLKIRWEQSRVSSSLTLGIYPPDNRIHPLARLPRRPSFSRSVTSRVTNG